MKNTFLHQNSLLFQEYATFAKKGHHASMCFKKQNIKAVYEYEAETADTDTDSEGHLKKIDVLTLGNIVSLIRIQTNG